MFFSLFLSKNQKLVHTWKQEHKHIVELATKIFEVYHKGNHDEAKKILEELRVVTLNHLMTEDVEFFRLLEDHKATDRETELFIKEFEDSFYNTKATLRHFLDNYTRKEAVLDDEFIEAFNGLVAVLAKRIDFEEKNLYSKLEHQ